MSDAAPPIQPDTKPSRSGRLLVLVRKLIDYAEELAATVRERVAAEPIFAQTCFGTADLAVIFNRIARGLLLANALEARVLRSAAGLDKGPRPRQSRSDCKPSADAHGADLPTIGPPTAEQIAAPRPAAGLDRVASRQPIGAVIADICRDLGIVPGHPLWQEVQMAIIEFSGNLIRLLRECLDRVFAVPDPHAAVPGPLCAPVLRPEAPSGTGPP